jgi:hypothetical protein
MLSTYGRCEVFVKHFVISYARAFVQFTIAVMGVLDLWGADWVLWDSFH